MDLINGPEYHLCCRENLPNNVSKDGMNGLTLVLKKPNGVEPKMKSFFNLQEYFRVSGEL